MRLSDVLSKPLNGAVYQIEGFLGGRPLAWGKHKNIAVGKVFLNFHCRKCANQRSFQSGEALACLGLGTRAVSIDVTLKCPGCEGTVEVWFVVGSENDIFGLAPEVQIERYTENLRHSAFRVSVVPGQFADLLTRAQLSYESGLGAGAMVYLRKIFELITYEVAEIQGIAVFDDRARRQPFKKVLKEVDEARQIIPPRYRSNGYTLFSELSEVIHGNSDEEDALLKFEPCRDLVVGVVHEVNRDNVFARAIEDLGWDVDNLRLVNSAAVGS
jgi:hypothetical protein